MVNEAPHERPSERSLGRPFEPGGAALVLFSGGQDSTTCLAWALERFERVETIAFDYRQRHRIELDQRLKVLDEVRRAFPRWADRLGEDHFIDMGVLGQISDTWFDRAGNFHGAGMKVTERYTPIDADHLQYEATIDDPTTFSRPWKISMPLYRRVEPDARLIEYECFAMQVFEGGRYDEMIRRMKPAAR